MSRILINVLRKVKKYISVFIALSGLLCVCLGWFFNVMILCTGGGILLLAVLNEAVSQKMRRQKAPFDTRSRVRNVDHLVIGDLFPAPAHIPAETTYVQISAPDRSLAASYEILRHTSSILREQGGTVILATQDKNVDKYRFSLFDVPFFTGFTLDRLHLKRFAWEVCLPIIFEPFRSIRFLLDKGRSDWTTAECPMKEICTFCAERGFLLIYKRR